MWGRMYPHAVLLIFANIILKASCKGSLTFLIDDTLSMTDDIAQVKRNVDRISNVVFNEKSSVIENMVLVTFNDPDAQLRVVTKNRNTFKRTLDAVYVHNYMNMDCWEPSMNGLLLALDKSNSNSYIYVFTDASAKDYKDARFVKELCQKKQTQIIFVLTGQCHWYTAEAFDIYFDIAQACSGLAFNVGKTEVNEVIGPIEATIKGNKTVITSTTVPAGVKKDIPFTIDDHTDYAIISASGENVDLKIRGPPATEEKIMWNKNGKVIKLGNAKPGKYVATVKGKTKTYVIVVGRTDFFFTHGFSKLKPKSLSDTSLQPIADTKVHLSISITDEHHAVQIVSAQILDMNEKPMYNPMPLTEISKHFYGTNPFVAPSQRFKIAVNGVVKATGKPIRRIAKIPITPAEPPKILPNNTKPTVKIPEGKAIEIEYNSTVKLTCKVIAFPEPKIEWINNKGGRLPSKMSLQEYPYKYISYMDISYAQFKEDRYKCFAMNNEGRDEATIKVSVKEPFTVNSTPSGITKLTYGTEGTVNCDVTSRLPMDIHWYYANEMTGQTRKIETSDKYEVSASRTQLKIKKMDLDLVGRYTCKVSLKNKKDKQISFNTRVKVDGLMAPKVQGGTEIKATKGKTAIVECKVVSGLPAPKITWLFGGESGSMFTPLAGSETVMRITNVEEKHKGKYKCVAENAAGKDEHVTTLFVQVLPKITTKSSMVYQATEGDTLLKIPCVAAGIPKPVIVWKLSGRYITPSAKYVIEDGTLIIKNPTVSDTNSYTCEAKNEAGAVSTTLKTYIRQAPKVSGITFKKARLGKPASIECMIQGEPKPTITWNFMDNSGSKFLPIPGSDRVLNFPRVEDKHAGRYKCVATNEIGSNEHITTLVVEFAPEIIKNSSTVEGIEGDLALRIPCDVVGIPKPVITWKLNGVTITPDSKYTIEDGALVIMKPTEKDSSLYSCEAKNYISTASTTFQATVKKLPTNFGTEHFVYLLEGETKKLKCDPYTSPATQSIKWFITKKRSRARDSSMSSTSSPPELESSEATTASSKDYSPTPRSTITTDADIKESSIQITKASFSEHDGNYTCRVSDKHGNTHTHTYVVDVGRAPEFFADASLVLSDWRGVISDITQNCDIRENAKPKPVVEWRFNGKVLTDLNSAGLGHYTCNVSNAHGSVQRTFDVKSSVCLITRNLGTAHMQYMPLVLDDKGFWHKLENKKHYTLVEQEGKITLSCPSTKESSNTFKNFPKKNRLEAFCYKEDSFTVEGKNYKFSDLQCTNSIQPSVIRKKGKCLTETSELLRVGYNVPGFLEAYEVCFDTKKNMPLYTRIIMTETNNNGPSAGYNWYTYPGIANKKTNGGFTCKDTMSSCCYSKSQLVNAIDFNDGPAKRSTFIDPLNAIPVWLPCNASQPSWKDINDMVRTQLPTYIDIVTWSGTHTLQEKNGAIIPRYLWKVVRFDADDDEAVAIVHVNDPKPNEKDIKCKTQDICNKYEDWFISNDKYTYCCSLPDFFKSFDIHDTDIGESMDAVLKKIDSST